MSLDKLDAPISVKRESLTRARAPCKSEPAAVKALYYIMQSMEGKLGGGEGIEGLYGSITCSGMQRILDCLATSCGLTQTSHVVDVGAGLGRPLLHALVNPGVRAASGIEIDKIKCNKAAAFLKYSVKELSRRTGNKALVVPTVRCSSIEKVDSLEPGTHAYSFWEGVPIEGKCAFGRLFAMSSTMKSVAVVQRAIRARDPAEEMQEMGFGLLTLVKCFSVSMSGSGRSFKAYIFNKTDYRQDTEAQICSSLPMPCTPAILDGKTAAAQRSDEDLHSKSPSHSVRSGAVHVREAIEPAAEQTTLAQDKPGQFNQSPETAPLLTPVRQRNAAGMPPATPTSLGKLGPARRVPLQEASDMQYLPSTSSSRAEAGKSKMDAQTGKQQSLPGLLRRSTRLNAMSTSSRNKPAQRKENIIKASPGKIKGVQKSESPQKSLQALGFRSRRSADRSKIKQVDLPGMSMIPKGLRGSIDI